MVCSKQGKFADGQFFKYCFRRGRKNDDGRIFERNGHRATSRRRIGDAFENGRIVRRSEKSDGETERRVPYARRDRFVVFRIDREARGRKFSAVSALLYRLRQEHNGGEKRLHQFVLLFSRPRGNRDRRRNAYRAPSGDRHAEPRPCAGKTARSAPEEGRRRQKRMDRLARHSPFGRKDRR